MVEIARFLNHSENQDGDATCYLQYLARFFGKNFHEFNLFCCRLTTVTNKGVHNPSNDSFSRCKSAKIGYR